MRKSLLSSGQQISKPPSANEQTVNTAALGGAVRNRRAGLIYNTLALVGAALFGATYFFAGRLAHHHVPDWAFQLIRAGSGIVALGAFSFANSTYKRLGLAQDRQEIERLDLPAGFDPAQLTPFTIPTQGRQALPAIGAGFGLLAAIFLELAALDTRPGPQDDQMRIIGLILLAPAVLAFVFWPLCPRLQFEISREGILVPCFLRQRFFRWDDIDHFEATRYYGIQGNYIGANCSVCTFAGERVLIFVDSYTNAKVMEALRERLQRGKTFPEKAS